MQNISPFDTLAAPIFQKKRKKEKKRQKEKKEETVATRDMGDQIGRWCMPWTAPTRPTSGAVGVCGLCVAATVLASYWPARIIYPADHFSMLAHWALQCARACSHYLNMTSLCGIAPLAAPTHLPICLPPTMVFFLVTHLSTQRSIRPRPRSPCHSTFITPIYHPSRTRERAHAPRFPQICPALQTLLLVLIPNSIRKKKSKRSFACALP